MECIFLNFKDMLECVVMYVTLMRVINVLLLNLSNRFIGIISLDRLFPNSIVDTMNWFQNSVFD